MSSPERVTADPATSRRFDIELLRVVAVVGVVLFHFAPGWSLVPNGYLGVDVFFTISGFVITAQLLRSRDRGTLTYPDFLARRVRRLLPSAVVVIVATYAVVLLSRNVVMIDSQRPIAIAALLYVSNFLFAHQALDYFATVDAPSPFLHYWSLSVEEQFYLVWPIVVIALAAAFRRRPGRFGRAVLWTALGLSVVSLAAAWWSLRVMPDQTFFMPWARAHQLLIGAATAVLVHAVATGGRRPLTLPPVVLTPLRLAAIALLVTLQLVPAFEIASPGPVALLVSIPVAFIALTGTGEDVLSRVGGWWPFAWIARLSYVVYLWHWPVWVYILGQLGTLSGVQQILLASAITLVLSVITHFLVEQPFRDGHWVRRMPPLRTAALGLGASIVAAGVVAGAAAAAPVHPWQEDVKPAMAALADDKADVYDRGCHAQPRDTTPIVCEDGPPSDTVVMSIGDSHAATWQPVWQRMADEDGWRFVNVTKSACAPWDVPTSLDGERYAACDTWRDNAFALAAEQKADVVVLHGAVPWSKMLDRDGRPVTDRAATLRKAVTSSVRKAGAEGARVVVMLDTPATKGRVQDCLAVAADPGECDFRSTIGSADRKVVRHAAEAAGAVVVDPYPLVCPGRTCRVVQDHVVVYRDAHHLTRTYVLREEAWVRSWLDPLLGP